MSFFTAILLAFLAVFLIGLAQILWRLYRGYRTVKKLMNGQLSEDDLLRMMGQAGSTAGSRQQRPQRTTQTREGVTIIDRREPAAASKKIFPDDEGEYVDFTESN